jgi:hypothetical protein
LIKESSRQLGIKEIKKDRPTGREREREREREERERTGISKRERGRPLEQI